MERSGWGFALWLVAVTLVWPPATPSAAARPAHDAYIVVLQDHVDAARLADEHARDHGASVEHVYEHALKGYAARIPAARLARVQGDARVRFVHADLPIRTAGSTVPMSTNDKAPTGVRRIEAAASENGSVMVHQASTVAVAVLDTGINLTHADLNARSGKNCTVKSPRATASDDNGHGSHVAGIIGARDNGGGIVGVTPGTVLYAVKVLDSRGNGTTSTLICGIDWVTANAATLNIRVANMSLVGNAAGAPSQEPCETEALHLAICNSIQRAKVIYVAAAGNDNQNLATYVPAAYREVLTVTAIQDRDGAPGDSANTPTLDTWASFSNYALATDTNSIFHTMAAPGFDIYSTWYTASNHYTYVSGTSMAAPHVAGVAALCLGYVDKATNASVPGPCSTLDGGVPANVIQRLRTDAANRTGLNADIYAAGYYGFIGDPNNPRSIGVTQIYYGWLVNARAY